MGKEEVVMIYRFRSAQRVLKHKELENTEIYFSPYDELNDPMEGFLNVVWQGDDVAWIGLITHYVLMMQYTSMGIFIGGKYEDIKQYSYMRCIEDCETESLKSLVDKIIETVISTHEVKNLISTLGNSDICINDMQLTTILQMLHRYFLSCVIKENYNSGLISEDFYESIRKLLPEDEQILAEIRKIIPVIENKNTTALGIGQPIYMELMLIAKMNIPDMETRNREIQYLFFDFPNEYVKKVQELMYPQFYVACFSKNFEDSSMWGNYADEHKGICLMFEEKLKDDKKVLPFHLATALVGDTEKYEFVNRQLHKMSYNIKNAKINFFENLGRLNGIQLSSWLMHNGKKSRAYDVIYRDMEKWRREYWGFFRDEVVNSKTLDWQHEQEYRVYIDNTFWNYDDKNKRKVKYQFADLHGIIFGIKTPDVDKIEIIKIIRQKCNEERRSDFHFYQAYYDQETGKISYHEMGLINKGVNYTKEDSISVKSN